MLSNTARTPETGGEASADFSEVDHCDILYFEVSTFATSPMIGWDNRYFSRLDDDDRCDDTGGDRRSKCCCN